jgi:hypothetical protein
MARPSRDSPPHYLLRVDGHLDDRWSTRLDDLELEQQDDGTTTLTGRVQDQAQLHGLLTKIRDLGLTLIQLDLINDP